MLDKLKEIYRHNAEIECNINLFCKLLEELEKEYEEKKEVN